MIKLKTNDFKMNNKLAKEIFRKLIENKLSI